MDISQPWTRSGAKRWDDPKELDRVVREELHARRVARRSTRSCAWANGLSDNKSRPCGKPCVINSKHCETHIRDDPDTDVISAAKEGDLNLAKFLIDNKYVDAVSTDGYDLALANAAWAGHELLVQYFLDQPGVKLDDGEQRSPLWWAAKQGHEAICLLLANREDIEVDGTDLHGQSPLYMAATYGKRDIVRLLLDREDVDVNRKNKNGKTPLWVAAQNGHTPVAKLLVTSKNVNLRDECGRTPLYIAARNGYDEIVDLLLAHEGVEVDAKTDDDQTPLWIASRRGRSEIVNKLLRQNASLNSKDKDGRTPLWIAAWMGHESIVASLLSRKAVEVEEMNNQDETPLWIATKRGKEAVVRHLLEHNADIHSKDIKGRTPLSIAKTLGKSAIVDLLTVRLAEESIRL